jgi:hypothetical protein
MFNSAEAFTKHIYTLSKFAGYPVKFFSGHSFRVGKIAFECAKAANETKNLSTFLDIFQAHRILGGWLGERIKLYIRNHATRFMHSKTKPINLSVEQIHNQRGFRLNPVTMINIQIQDSNYQRLRSTAEAWIDCYGHDFFDNICNINPKFIHLFYKVAAFRLKQESQVFNTLCESFTSKDYIPGNLLIWLVTAGLIDAVTFRQSFSDSINSINQILTNMSEIYYQHLSLPKPSALEKQPPRVVQTIPVQNSVDPSLTIANVANRRRVNANFE